MLFEACAKLPKEKQKGFMLQGWSKLKAHFKAPYRQIPSAEFPEAVSIVARHITGDYLPAGSPLNAIAPPASLDSNLSDEALDALAARELTKPGVQFITTFVQAKDGSLRPQLSALSASAEAFTPDGVVSELTDNRMGFFGNEMLPTLVQAVSKRLACIVPAR